MSANSHIRMLSIDDKTLTTDLDRAGYRKMGVLVKPAATYDEAESFLSTGKIDIIVINLDFNRVNGVETVRHIKKQEQYSQIPLVTTSVRTSARVRNSALDAGADLFIEQPLPRQFFIEKLKGLLDQQTRTNQRLDVAGSASFSWQGNESECYIGDVSSTGLLLATETKIDDGTSLEIKLTLPGLNKPISVVGEVVRTIKKDENYPDRVAGIGVKFLKFSGDSEKRLEKYIIKTDDQENKMVYYL